MRMYCGRDLLNRDSRLHRVPHIIFGSGPQPCTFCLEDVRRRRQLYQEDHPNELPAPLLQPWKGPRPVLTAEDVDPEIDETLEQAPPDEIAASKKEPESDGSDPQAVEEVDSIDEVMEMIMAGTATSDTTPVVTVSYDLLSVSGVNDPKGFFKEVELLSQ